jgi:hypothetical protein
VTDRPSFGSDTPPEEPSGTDALSAAAKNVSSQLTSGERLVAIGALLVLVVCWVLGTLILDEYGLSNTSVLIPIGVLAAMYFYYSGKKAAWHALYGTVVKVGAWAMAIIAFYALIDDTIITSNRYSGATLLFELTFYVAGALFAVGAWQLRNDDR